MRDFFRRLWAILASLRHPNRTTVVDRGAFLYRECPGQGRERYGYVCMQESMCNLTGRCQILGRPMPEGR